MDTPDPLTAWNATANAPFLVDGERASLLSRSRAAGHGRGAKRRAVKNQGNRVAVGGLGRGQVQGVGAGQNLGTSHRS